MPEEARSLESWVRGRAGSGGLARWAPEDRAALSSMPGEHPAADAARDLLLATARSGSLAAGRPDPLTR